METAEVLLNITGYGLAVLLLLWIRKIIVGK